MAVHVCASHSIVWLIAANTDEPAGGLAHVLSRSHCSHGGTAQRASENMHLRRQSSFRRIFQLFCCPLATALMVASLASVSADTALDLVTQLSGDRGVTVLVSKGKDYLTTMDAPEGTDPLERIEALGFTAYTSANGEMMVLFQKDEEQSEASLGRPIVAASRVVAALNMDELRVGEHGAFKCSEFNPEARMAMVRWLESMPGWFADRGLAVTEATIPDNLFLSFSPRYQLFTRHVDERRNVQVHSVSGYGWYTHLPPVGIPQKDRTLTKSLLWWMWPYSESAWGERTVSELDLAGGTVGEVLSHIAKQIGGEFLLGSIAAEVTDKPLCLAGKTARLGRMIWALEIATGYHFHAVCTDPFVFVVASSAVLPRLTRPEEFEVIPKGEGTAFWSSRTGLLALERAGYHPLPPGTPRDIFAAFDAAYIAPSESAAGRYFLNLGRVGDVGLPAVAAWRIEELPDIYTWALRWPPEAENGRILIWIGGLEVSLEKRQGGRGRAMNFFLPEF